MFKNLQLFRLPVNWPIGSDNLSAQLGTKRFLPCGAQEMESSGWDAVIGDDLVRCVDGQWIIRFGVDQRILPSAVIRQATDERIKEVERTQGFAVGRRQRREIRENVTAELMPRAFTRRSSIMAWIDPSAGFLAVDAPSRNVAEDVIGLLHKSLDELPLKLLNTKLTPQSAMTTWLAAGEAPEGFSIDQDCELRALTDSGSAVRYVRHTLDGVDVREHMSAGKQVSKLAMTFDNSISFVLGAKFEIKRLQFIGIAESDVGEQGADPVERFDADVALHTGMLRKLIPALLEALGGEVADV